MKAKKAIRKLAHAEELLAEVAESFAESGEAVDRFIEQASLNAAQARAVLEDAAALKGDAKKTPVTVPRKNLRTAAARRTPSRKKN